MCVRTTPCAIHRLCTTKKGVSPSADKVKAVKEYRIPKNAKGVGAFLNLAHIINMG
jgi:hypothetical protein